MAFKRATRQILFSFSLLPVFLGGITANQVQAQAPAHAATILTREEAAPLIPATVFYKGQVAPVQARNSAGLRFADSKFALAALVDTSGYSTAVQQTYQGYLLVERTLQVGDKTVAPGAYGFGFIAGDRMVIMDLGANEILSTATTRDANIGRPNPLQILPDPASTSRFRLYLGRNYVTLEVASK
jgi:hypothetical protein